MGNLFGLMEQDILENGLMESNMVLVLVLMFKINKLKSYLKMGKKLSRLIKFNLVKFLFNMLFYLICFYFYYIINALYKLFYFNFI